MRLQIICCHYKFKGKIEMRITLTEGLQVIVIEVVCELPGFIIRNKMDFQRKYFMVLVFDWLNIC